MVGGGITSAHVVRVLLELGCTEVTLLVRSELRERQFDLHESWFGPGRGKLLKDFHTKCPAERLEAIANARGGGSMPPESRAMIDSAVAAGKLTVLIGEEISSARWVWKPEANMSLATRSPAATTNTTVGVTTEVDLEGCLDQPKGAPVADRVPDSSDASSDPGLVANLEQQDGFWNLSFDSAHPPMECDVLLLGTGADLDLDQYDVFTELRRECPIEVCNGLPVLQHDLSWAPNEQVYVMGALAAVQLGPDALNLAGARHGACRLARRLRPDLAAG